MDAFLTPAHIKMIEYMQNETDESSRSIFLQNDYKVNASQNVQIVETDLSKESKTKIQDFIINLIRQNERLVIPCAYKKYAEVLRDAIEKNVPEARVVVYHGEDEKLEEDGSFHKELKKSHFDDVESAWINYDVVIYTATLCAGVSFNMPHFD